MSGSSQAPARTPLLSDVNYNRLKKTATIVLPAVLTLYVTLAQIWHFPKLEETILTISAVNTALGGLIQVSKKSYYASGAQFDGVMKITDTGAKTVASLDLKKEPEDIIDQQTVTFRVDRDTGETPIVKA